MAADLDLTLLARVVGGGIRGTTVGELMTSLSLRPQAIKAWADRARRAGWPIERCGGGSRPVRYRLHLSDAYDALHGFGARPRAQNGQRGHQDAEVAA